MPKNNTLPDRNRLLI